MKKKNILSSSFKLNATELFNVPYNLKDQDPDKAGILRGMKSEEDVAAWEKAPMAVSISTLFSPEKLRGASPAAYSDIQSFLKTANAQARAPAAEPAYSQGVQGMVTASRNSASPEASGGTSVTIADERFDSIVVVRNARSLGTGFYVTPDLVLTSYHVIAGVSLVEMTLYDGTKAVGKVVDHDVRLDLALIKTQATGKPLKVYAGPIKLGETVEAIGHPKGYEFTITRGVISAVRKQRGSVIGSANLVEFVQTDTPISAGNSGGPLFLKDAVIGVNDWMRVDKGAQNLNFSVSFNEIREYLTRYAGH